jgi:hypothetical protein
MTQINSSHHDYIVKTGLTEDEYSCELKAVRKILNSDFGIDSDSGVFRFLLKRSYKEYLPRIKEERAANDRKGT